MSRFSCQHLIAGLIAGWMGFFLLTGPVRADRFHVDRFISPDVCAGCHADIYDQWQNSMHNLSHPDAAYIKIARFLRKGLVNPDEIKEAESCVKCHTPVGYVTGYPTQLSDDPKRIPEIAEAGIQCDYCHSAVSTDKLYNNGLMLSPGNGEDDPGVKLGPFDDARPDFHEAAYSEFHTRSEICGSCHNVKHVVFGTDLETTYDEWKSSPYYSDDPARAVTCQGCHMYQRPGVPATGSTPRPPNPGPASDYTDERPHIFTHYFVGANYMIPGQAGDDEKVKMARERLQHAAELTIDSVDLKNRVLKIKVANTGAGHSIPTGVTDLRQVWLQITISDSKGRTVFSSGHLDGNGYLGADAVAYRTEYGDENGKPTANIAKARKILKDYRIPSGQFLIETIRLPENVAQGMSVEAVLMYRSLPHRLLDQIPGASGLKPDAVRMAAVRSIL